MLIAESTTKEQLLRVEESCAKWQSIMREVSARYVATRVQLERLRFIIETPQKRTLDYLTVV
jgi:hypothetical protein